MLRKRNINEIIVLILTKTIFSQKQKQKQTHHTPSISTSLLLESDTTSLAGGLKTVGCLSKDSKLLNELQDDVSGISLPQALILGSTR